MSEAHAYGNNRDRIAAGSITLGDAATLRTDAGATAALAAIREALTGSIITVARESAEAVTHAAYAVALAARAPITAAEALRIVVAENRDGRDDGGDDAASVSLTDEHGAVEAPSLMLTDAEASRSVTIGGARFTIRGTDGDTAALVYADGSAVTGSAAIIAAQALRLAVESEAAHGSAAAARGAKNSATATVTDSVMAALIREHGSARGYALRIAEALGWITAEASAEEREAAGERVRQAVRRMRRRTGEDHSTRQ